MKKDDIALWFMRMMLLYKLNRLLEAAMVAEIYLADRDDVE